MKTRLIVGLMLALGAGKSFAGAEENLSFGASHPMAIALEKALTNLYWEQNLFSDSLPMATLNGHIEIKKAIISQGGTEGEKLVICKTKVAGEMSRAPLDIFLGCEVSPYIEPVVTQNLPQLTVWKFLFFNK